VGRATSAANRGWSSLQVNPISPDGDGWRVRSVKAATIRKAWANIARVVSTDTRSASTGPDAGLGRQGLAGLEALLDRQATLSDPDQGARRHGTGIQQW